VLPPGCRGLLRPLTGVAPLQGDVGGLLDGHLQHQAPRVVRDAAHDVQPPRRACDHQLVLPAEQRRGRQPLAGRGPVRRVGGRQVAVHGQARQGHQERRSVGPARQVAVQQGEGRESAAPPERGRNWKRGLRALGGNDKTATTQ
jgi:hypothetical protein